MAPHIEQFIVTTKPGEWHGKWVNVVNTSHDTNDKSLKTKKLHNKMRENPFYFREVSDTRGEKCDIAATQG